MHHFNIAVYFYMNDEKFVFRYSPCSHLYFRIIADKDMHKKANITLLSVDSMN